MRGLALHHFSSLSDFNTENKKKDEQKKQQKQTNTHTHWSTTSQQAHKEKVNGDNEQEKIYWKNNTGSNSRTTFRKRAVRMKD